jgi:hypothetical protein
MNCHTTLGHIFEGVQTIYKRDACTPMFIAALFTVVKLQIQPRCRTTNEWIKKPIMYIYLFIIYINIYEYYSVLKNNEIISFVGKWIELEISC